MAETSGQAPVVGEGEKVIVEGKASILQKGNDVFYNKAQVVNRDVSLAVLRWFIKTRAAETAQSKPRLRQKGLPPAPLLAEKVEGIRILEGLAATGLRAIRYAMELEGVGQVVANDMDAGAVASMQRSIEHNGGAARAKITPHHADARTVMMQNLEAFDAVDLDPYGTPATLLDSALQAVNEGGLLMVTATDMAVLCGNNPETCFTKYGCFSLHRPYCHEQALRILLACVLSHAARHKKFVVPVVSLSIDFYVRIFVRVYTSPKTAKETASKLSYIWQSTGCDAWWLQAAGRMTTKSKTNAIKFQPSLGPVVPQKCPISDGNFVMGGPIWSGRLHDEAAIQDILTHVKESASLYPSHAKLVGLLTAVNEELLDCPLYFNIPDLSKTLKTATPKSELFRHALVNAGYKASPTHCCQTGLKTDAPPEVVFDIMRCWVKKNGPVKIADETSYQAKILAKEPTIEANFSNAPGTLSIARSSGQARFVQNPDNWGPRPRHGRPMLKHEQATDQAADAPKEAGSDDLPAAKRAKTDDAAEAGGAAGSEVPK